VLYFIEINVKKTLTKGYTKTVREMGHDRGRCYGLNFWQFITPLTDKNGDLKKAIKRLHFSQYLQPNPPKTFTYVPTSRHCTLEPILRLLNLQLQRQRCSSLERFSKQKKLLLFLKTL
jgi:hypothetical protein